MPGGGRSGRRDVAGSAEEPGDGTDQGKGGPSVWVSDRTRGRSGEEASRTVKQPRATAGVGPRSNYVKSFNISLVDGHGRLRRNSR